MKVILRVPDEGYSERTWWRLFQKRVARTKFDIYDFIIGFIPLTTDVYIWTLLKSENSVRIIKR
jgi:hypothetical protein